MIISVDYFVPKVMYALPLIHATHLSPCPAFSKGVKKERQKKTCSPFLSRGDETSSCLLNISMCSVAGAIDKFEKEVARFVSPPFIRIAGNFFSF